MGREDELDRIRGRLRTLLAARFGGTLTRGEEDEYKRLCHREWELLSPAATVDLTDVERAELDLREAEDLAEREVEGK